MTTPAISPTAPSAPVTPRNTSRVSRITAFREGLAAPMAGFSFMNRHPGLWRYAVIPIVLNLLITALVLGLLIAAGVWFAVKMHPRFDPGWWGLTKEVMAAVGLLVLAILGAVGTWILLNGILCGYFYLRLARQVELALGTRPEELSEVPMMKQVVDAVRDLLALVGITVGLLVLHVVPVLGSALALVLTLYFDSFIFGRDYLAFPLDLRARRRADQLAIAKAHRWQTVGLGLAVFLLSLIPVVGSVGQSTAATGSVLMYKRWRDAGEV